MPVDPPVFPCFVISELEETVPVPLLAFFILYSSTVVHMSNLSLCANRHKEILRKVLIAGNKLSQLKTRRNDKTVKVNSVLAIMLYSWAHKGHPSVPVVRVKLFTLRSVLYSGDLSVSNEQNSYCIIIFLCKTKHTDYIYDKCILT